MVINSASLLYFTSSRVLQSPLEQEGGHALPVICSQGLSEDTAFILET